MKRRSFVGGTAAGALGLTLAGCRFARVGNEPRLTELAPPFSLTDQGGMTVTREDVVADGPGVVVFYRGFW